MLKFNLVEVIMPKLQGAPITTKAVGYIELQFPPNVYPNFTGACNERIVHDNRGWQIVSIEQNTDTKEATLFAVCLGTEEETRLLPVEVKAALPKNGLKKV